MFCYSHSDSGACAWRKGSLAVVYMYSRNTHRYLKSLDDHERAILLECSVQKQQTIFAEQQNKEHRSFERIEFHAFTVSLQTANVILVPWIMIGISLPSYRCGLKSL